MSEADEASTTWTVGKKHIYRALRNLLVNEMGISREVVQQYMTDIIKAYITNYVDDHLVHSTWFVKLVDNAVATAAKRAVTDRLQVMGGTVTFTMKPDDKK